MPAERPVQLRFAPRWAVSSRSPAKTRRAEVQAQVPDVAASPPESGDRSELRLHAARSPVGEHRLGPLDCVWIPAQKRTVTCTAIARSRGSDLVSSTTRCCWPMPRWGGCSRLRSPGDRRGTPTWKRRATRGMRRRLTVRVCSPSSSGSPNSAASEKKACSTSCSAPHSARP